MHWTLWYHCSKDTLVFQGMASPLMVLIVGVPIHSPSTSMLRRWLTSALDWRDLWATVQAHYISIPSLSEAHFPVIHVGFTATPRNPQIAPGWPMLGCCPLPPPALPQCLSVYNGQSPLPQSFLDLQCTCSYSSLVALQLPHGHTIGWLTQSWLVTASFMGKAWYSLVNSGSYGHTVNCWMVAEMVAVHDQCYWMFSVLPCSEQCYWMHEVSCYWGYQFLSQVCFSLCRNISCALGPWDWRHEHFWCWWVLLFI